MKKRYILFLLLFTNLLLAQASQTTYSINSLIPNKNFIYLSPVPGSILNSAQTNIIIRSSTLLNTTALNDGIITAIGSISGNHSGKLKLADDGKTILFLPSLPFSSGENVFVELKNGLSDINNKSLGNVSFNFSISPNNSQMDYKTLIDNEISMSRQIIQLRLTLQKSSSQKSILNPSGGFLPTVFPQTSLFATNPSPGQLFISSFSNDPLYSDKDFLLLLDNTGQPFFYKKMNGYNFGLTLQPNGNITYYNAGTKYFFFVMDTTFQVIDSVKCGNGYQTDVHELRILPNGHYLVIGDEIQKIDMSKIVNGGNPNASVTGIVIQELDNNKDVVFQWRSFDHFQITDALGQDLTAAIIEPVHTNAIELDNDGNILISNRHMDEITKINRQTGDIIWRWGGKNNQFNFINDNVGFSHQHAVRRIANGNITLFDNGNLHTAVLPSRALEYKLDEKNMTAELVWQYLNQPAEISSAMGYVQRLENGNTLIGWGMANPTITEVTPSGEKVFELNLPENVWSYRAFRFNLTKPYYSSFVPRLTDPVNKMILSDTTAFLEWSKNRFANSFHLQIATDTSFNNIFYDRDNIIDTIYSIKGLTAGQDYYWHVAANNNSDLIGGYSGFSDTKSFHVSNVVAVKSNNLPTSFSLSQNYPNPFNPSTVIKYSLPKNAFVQLTVYDILGRQIVRLVDGFEAAGYYSQQFNSGNLPSGLYIYQILALDPISKSTQIFQSTKKMLLVK